MVFTIVRRSTNPIVVAALVAALLAFFIVQAERVASPAAALPTSAVDESKVPHYFGPYPNWSNSQFTLPDAAVTITGDGTGAEATATVGANGEVTGLTLTNPGSGYTNAAVAFTGAGSGAAATATVAASGAVTGVEVTAAGSGYTAPTVEFSGGGGTGTLVEVGNPLQDRAYATDFEANDPVRVLVVVPAALPTGTLTQFASWNQATSGGSPTPSAGGSFHAYVLRPNGPANEYTVAFDSGLLTVPALTTPGVSERVNYPVPGGVPVQAGDVIAFYGSGVPVDTGAGADVFVYPAPTAPTANQTLTVGSADFPLFGQAREYSFGASVLDNSGVTPLTAAKATAYGSVDAITLDGPGAGYSFPTIDIDFPDGPDGVQATAHAVCGTQDPCAPATDGATVTITEIVVDNPGSGYSKAPNVVIRNGTLAEPVNPPENFAVATASATLEVSSIVVDDPGDGYVTAPTVTINGTNTTPAEVTATVNAGAITGLTLDAGGSGYITAGIKKFEDALPALCDPAGANAPACRTTGKYIPLGVPEAKTYNGIEADEYVIGLVQYRTSFSSSLDRLQAAADPAAPAGTLVRGYVQLETADNAAISQHWPVTNELLNGTKVPVNDANGDQWLAVTPPQWLGPTIAATKNKPVRIVFHNLLPTGEDGDLFLPTDSTLMGSGMIPMDNHVMPTDSNSVEDEVRNPVCTEYPKGADCFKDNRATLHLHGGITPWISDGTPHQWITPAGETTGYPQGVSVGNVPDMNVCEAENDGCQTFYYTNQQSARLMFYHDHAWGITRLNVYAGEAAGYMISDDTEKRLISDGIIPADQLPLIVQDRTFVPTIAQLAQQDPTWDTDRWGGMGNFWYHHVYMPAQNPGDPSGMSSYGRWMYGPWFWPPATPPHGPIPNPYYNMDPEGPDNVRGTTDDFTSTLAVPCNLDDPSTWQYDTDPFCEPKEIPGTPNISVGMEQFNDTPIVNGVAYPTVTLEPKAYRLRMLNAANDRFFNFQWYVGDAATASTDPNKAGDPIGATEVALKPDEVAAAQTDPVAFPTPVDAGVDAAGPDWIQIGTEGGFLPAPAVVDGQQPTTWITDPTRFDVGNVDQHSLLLAPAERADAIVDFSEFAGKTLILYNDAPAAFPARVPSYDYYTGAPDQFPNAAPGILPGYGPNTRTVMQVKIADTNPAEAFDLPNTTNDGLGKLKSAFSHKADGTGAFEEGQPPIIVGQAAYNSAYGTDFAASSDCNAAGSTSTRCDGLVRISDGTNVTGPGSTWGFNTLKSPDVKTELSFEPKAIHDEMNSTTFDEFGRMTANLGIEAKPPKAGLQNVTLYPFVNPQTELIDATNLPKHDVAYEADPTLPNFGLPKSEVKITPMASAKDGTQIWRVTHNGVDTHPIHFHLYDVQVLNRVAWDNIITQTDPNELGWKDTVRMNPLQDTIVALRPIIPELPWELPNAVRPLNPMMPLNDTTMFNNIDPLGNPTAPIVNKLVNYGWEYVVHCHILSHEEMDMMRPVSVAMPPVKADGLVRTVSGGRNQIAFNDNSISETAYSLQKSANGITWTDVATSPSPLDQANTAGGTRSLTDTTSSSNAALLYRIAAKNTVGYGAEFPSMTVQSTSTTIVVNPPAAAPAAPTTLTAAVLSGPRVSLTWRDNATNEGGFVIERATGDGTFAQIGVAPARSNTGNTTYVDTTVQPGTTYRYRVAAVNLFGGVATLSAYSNTVDAILPPAPAAPTSLRAVNGASIGNRRSVNLSWTDNSDNETGFTIQRATNATFTAGLNTANVTANVTTLAQTGLARNTQYWYRIRAINGVSPSAWVEATPFPIRTNP